jgi:hypothetical protein
VQLHEAARHAIHSSETLSVTVDTLKALQQHALHLSNKTAARASEQIRAHLESQTRMLQNLLLRSQSNKERLHNEIALVKSTPCLQNSLANAWLDSQYDCSAGQPSNDGSRAGSQAGQWGDEDDRPSDHGLSTADVLIRKPHISSNQTNAECQQAIFSMSFFHYEPSQDNPNGEWSISEKFWIYWAFAIPLTCLTMGIWFWRQKMAQHVKKDI